MADYKVDILIVGGGLIGAALVHALLPTGLTVLMIDNQGPKDRVDEEFDARSVALSAASVRMLKMLNIWSEMAGEASVIDSIHVSEQGRFGTAYLEPKGAEPLGYVIDIQVMTQALYRRIDQKTLLAPAQLIAFDSSQRLATIQVGDTLRTVQASLFVAADGSDSVMRSLCQLTAQVKDYGQHALVANIGLARPHKQVAYERFTSSGPLALLPLGSQRMALVWSLLPEDAARMAQLSDADFLRALSKAFGYRLGRLVKVGRRVVYPLRNIFMTEQVTDGVVFIGNAAHTLHPVAGQGFNLGLRDVAMLAQSLSRYGLDHPSLLTHYCQSRQHDQRAITRFTDFLITLYSNQNTGVVLARQLGLVVMDNSAVLKRLLSRYASGFAGVVPDLVCEIPLQE